MAGAGTLEIVAVPAFADNYLWLVHDPASGETAVVDPGDAAPVLAAAEARGWRIGQVWNTHWHPDHTGGNQAVVAATGATLSAPAAEAAKIANIDVALKEGDTVRLGDHVGEVWEVPGHTLGHIALIFRDAGVAFVGDTLFAMGCGRLFEGTPEQMHASLQRLGRVARRNARSIARTNIRCPTRASPPPPSPTMRRLPSGLPRSRPRAPRGETTVPTTIGAEHATNPFLRAAEPRPIRRAPRMEGPILATKRRFMRYSSVSFCGGSAMTRFLAAALAASTIAGCAGQPMVADRDPRGEARLAQALAGKVAGRPISCLPSYRSNQMEVIDRDTILYRDGRTGYVQHTNGHCYPNGPRGRLLPRDALVRQRAVPRRHRPGGRFVEPDVRGQLFVQRLQSRIARRKP